MKEYKQSIYSCLCRTYQTLDVTTLKIHHLKCYNALFVQSKINGYSVELTYCLKHKKIESISTIIELEK